jgi:hypothetical protein
MFTPDRKLRGMEEVSSTEEEESAKELGALKVDEAGYERMSSSGTLRGGDSWRVTRAFEASTAAILAPKLLKCMQQVGCTVRC